MDETLPTNRRSLFWLAAGWLMGACAAASPRPAETNTVPAETSTGPRPVPRPRARLHMVQSRLPGRRRPLAGRAAKLGAGGHGPVWGTTGQEARHSIAIVRFMCPEPA